MEERPIKEKVTFDRKVVLMGGSLQINVPIELAQFIEIEKGDSVLMTADHGKYGKFVSFWKKPQETEE